MSHLSRTLSLLALTCIAAGWAAAAPQPISEVEIKRSGFLYNRQSDTFDATVTIKNVSTDTLAAPIRLLVESVKPVSTSLYNAYGKTAAGIPYVEVPIAGFALKSGASATVPVRFVNLGKTVTAATFSVLAQRLPPGESARLKINARMDAENGGNPVEPGYAVKVNGVTRALTDVEGRATVDVALDSTTVTVSSPPNFIGTAPIARLTAGEDRTVQVEVADSGEFGAESQLRIDRLQHLMLPSSVPLVVLRFSQNETPVASDSATSIELRSTEGGPPTDITNLFSLRSDGSLATNPASFFGAAGSLDGKKLLFAQVLDKKGVVHQRQIPFYISRHTIQARLSAPLSNPNLPLDAIIIDVSVLNTDISFRTESGADGSFPMPQLPSGSVLLRATTSSAGITYVGQGTAVISANSSIDLMMRGPADIANNVPPITSSPL